MLRQRRLAGFRACNSSTFDTDRIKLKMARFFTWKHDANIKKLQPVIALHISEQTVPPFFSCRSPKFQPNKILFPFPKTPPLQRRVAVIYSSGGIHMMSMTMMKFRALPPRGTELYVPLQNPILVGKTMLEHIWIASVTLTEADTNKFLIQLNWCEYTSMLHWYRV